MHSPLEAAEGLSFGVTTFSGNWRVTQDTGANLVAAFELFSLSRKSAGVSMRSGRGRPDGADSKSVRVLLNRQPRRAPLSSSWAAAGSLTIIHTEPPRKLSWSLTAGLVPPAQFYSLRSLNRYLLGLGDGLSTGMIQLNLDNVRSRLEKFLIRVWPNRLRAFVARA